MTKRNRRGIAGLILIFIIIIGDILVGATSSHVSVKGETLQYDSGWTTCTVAVGASQCTLTNGGCVFVGIGRCTSFHKTFLIAPNVTFAIQNDPSPSLGFYIPHTTTIIAAGTLADTWTAMPVATTEIFGSTKNRFNFATIINDYSSSLMIFTVNVAVAGSANAVLEVQLSPDQSTWTDPCNPLGSGDVAIASVGLDSASCTLNTNLAASAYLFGRIVGKNGNGIASPSFGMITVDFDMLLSAGSNILDPVVSTANFNATYVTPEALSLATSVTVSWIATACLSKAKSC